MNRPLPAASSARSVRVELELVAEQDLAGGGAEHVAADDAEHADAGHEQEQLAQAGLEVVVAAGADEPGELGQQRRLHGLEQQDRDAGEEEADDEVGGDVLCAGEASTRMPITGAYESSCASTEPPNSQPRFTESSDHGASGPGSISPCWWYSAVRLAKTGGSAKTSP